MSEPRRVSFEEIEKLYSNFANNLENVIVDDKSVGSETFKRPSLSMKT